MDKRKKSKGKYVCVWIVGILFILLVIAFFKFYIGNVTIRTNSKDYCDFEGFLGYSNLEIFPLNPTEIGKVENYYYSCIDTFMDPTCKVFMECTFSSKEEFEEECSRLSTIVVNNNSELNKIRYSEESFSYPAYITMYDWSSCYEYALLIEDENKIVYVFLQGDSQKVDEKYMPIISENADNSFSIYSFGGAFDLKYR